MAYIRLGLIENWRFAGDLNDFTCYSGFQLCIYCGSLANQDFDGLGDGAKSRLSSSQRIRASRQQLEAVGTGRIADRSSRDVGAFVLRDNLGTNYNGSGLIRDGALYRRARCGLAKSVGASQAQQQDPH